MLINTNNSDFSRLNQLSSYIFFELQNDKLAGSSNLLILSRSKITLNFPDDCFELIIHIFPLVLVNIFAVISPVDKKKQQQMMNML